MANHTWNYKKPTSCSVPDLFMIGFTARAYILQKTQVVIVQAWFSVLGVRMIRPRRGTWPARYSGKVSLSRFVINKRALRHDGTL